MSPPFVSIGSIISTMVGGEEWHDLLQWPPDVFAVAAVLLQRTGAYSRVVKDWPPHEKRIKPDEWASNMMYLGDKWRDAVNARLQQNGKRFKTQAKSAKIPERINSWWEYFLKHSERSISDIVTEPDLSAVLIQLLAAADEACAGIGVDPASRDNFDALASRYLYLYKTCAEKVAASLYAVLPKQHTPQMGLTLRSLSHHLALCVVGEVKPKWTAIPAPTELQGRSNLNLLLVPWPREVSALEFGEAEEVGTPSIRNLSDSMGFFSYTSKSGWNVDEFKQLLNNALNEVGQVDGVVFPELAFKSKDEFNEAADIVRSTGKLFFLVAGVGGKSEDGRFDSNSVRYMFCSEFTHDPHVGEQQKHHRWKLDEGQIRQYGLAHRLSPYKSWWENTEMKSRELHFLSVAPWLTFSLLICEDLARQDPVADILRAVGPNLIIALLMDGPQLQGRWSGRYATVFADDPGSSVLSLTSLGMSKRSKPAGLPASQSRERTIAIWKDAKGTAKEIEIPEDAAGVVLVLNCQSCNEWSADGRDDGSCTSYLTLGGIHPIKLGDACPS
jgi:hypothetical protein